MIRPTLTPFEPAEQHGAYRILEYLGNNRAGANWQQYRVACVKCGREKIRNRKDLEQSEANGSLQCQACYRANKTGPVIGKGKHCKQCEGQSWRRPNRLGLATRACQCGKMFARDVIPRPECLHSSGHIDNVATPDRKASLWV